MSIRNFGNSISLASCHRLLKGGTISGGPEKQRENPELEKVFYNLFFKIGIIVATTYLLYSFFK